MTQRNVKPSLREKLLKHISPEELRKKINEYNKKLVENWAGFPTEINWNEKIELADGYWCTPLHILLAEDDLGILITTRLPLRNILEGDLFSSSKDKDGRACADYSFGIEMKDNPNPEKVWFISSLWKANKPKVEVDHKQESPNAVPLLRAVNFHGMTGIGYQPEQLGVILSNDSNCQKFNSGDKTKIFPWKKIEFSQTAEFDVALRKIFKDMLECFANKNFQIAMIPIFIIQKIDGDKIRMYEFLFSLVREESSGNVLVIVKDSVIGRDKMKETFGIDIPSVVKEAKGCQQNETGTKAKFKDADVASCTGIMNDLIFKVVDFLLKNEGDTANAVKMLLNTDPVDITDTIARANQAIERANAPKADPSAVARHT